MIATIMRDALWRAGFARAMLRRMTDAQIATLYRLWIVKGPTP